MNEYNKALVIIRKTDKYKTKANSLLKLSVTTEDDAFKSKLNSLIKAYNNCLEPRYHRLKNDKTEGLPLSTSDNKRYVQPFETNLIVYIDEMTSKDVPIWQVLALRNGWKPPAVNN